MPSTSLPTTAPDNAGCCASRRRCRPTTMPRCTRCASSRSSIRMSKAAPPFSRLVLASNNAGKLKELQAMLGDDIEVLPQREFTDQEADETGLSFVENAILKARHAARA